jgi:mono/diheme cytochrome c family protein
VRWALPLTCALVALILLVSACGGTEIGGGGTVDPSEADTSTGKQLFVERCGSCHVLADAGTAGTIGPNLDNAFSASRAQGFSQSTFVEVVRWQIAFPGIGSPMPNQQALGLTDDQAVDIAGYVGRYAGNPDIPPSGGGEITATEGAAIFTQAGCGSCHTLAAAGSTGTIGPNLDDAKPPKDLAVERVTNGAGAMPSFADRLSEEQINAVADFVSQSAGG